MSIESLDTAQVRYLLARHCELAGVAGAQLSIVGPRGRIDVAHGFADAVHGRPMELRSRSQVGSFAKVLTAVLVHQLVDDGHLALTDEAADVAAAHGEHLPGLAGIEVGQLLSMTSGLDWGIWVEGDTVADALAPQLVLPRRAGPGSSFGYSFSSTLVAARLVELVRGTSWAQCVQRYIADPLDLSLSAFAAPGGARRADGTDVGDPAAGHEPTTTGWSLITAPLLAGMGPTGTTLLSCAADLATAANALCCNDGALLQTASRLALHQAVVPVGAHMVADAWCHGPYTRTVAPGPDPDFGADSGTWPNEPAQRLHGHGGRWAGGVCDVTWNAATGTSVAIVTNTPSRGASLVLGISRELHRLLWGHGAFVDQTEIPCAAGGSDLNGLAGRYVTANRVYDVGVESGRLVLTASSVDIPGAVFTLPDVTIELQQVGELRFLPVHQGRDERRLQEFWFSPASRQQDRPEFFYDGFVGARRERASATTAEKAAGS